MQPHPAVIDPAFEAFLARNDAEFVGGRVDCITIHHPQAPALTPFQAWQVAFRELVAAEENLTGAVAEMFAAAGAERATLRGTAKVAVSRMRTSLQKMQAAREAATPATMQLAA